MYCVCLLILHFQTSTTTYLATTPQQKAVVQHQVLVQDQEEINKMAAEEVKGDVSTEVFSSYTPQNSVFSSAQPHPADIVEAASLAVSMGNTCVKLLT